MNRIARATLHDISLLNLEGFKKGQEVSIQNPDGLTIPAIYVGEGESSTFFGGPPMVYLMIKGADHPVAVELGRVTGR